VSDGFVGPGLREVFLVLGWASRLVSLCADGFESSGRSDIGVYRLDIDSAGGERVSVTGKERRGRGVALWGFL
jgi:hypothetical protein